MNHDFAERLLADLDIPYEGIDALTRLLELKEEDIPEHKREVFQMFKPVLKQFLNDWINENQ